MARLNELAPRTRGLITQIEAPDDDSERLMALGVCVGRTVELLNAGDPLIIRVFASRVGLSARLAARVTVRPLPAAAAPVIATPAASPG